MASNCNRLLLHFMRSNIKKPAIMSPQKFLTCIEKAVQTVMVLDQHYKKEFNKVEAKSLFIFISLIPS